MDFLVSVFRGLLGITFLLATAYLFSKNRSKVDWSLVLKAIAVQLILAVLLIYVPAAEWLLNKASQFFVKIISFSESGSAFLFQSFSTGEIESGMINFVTRVLPTIIFFSALSGLMYYLGILQKVVKSLAWLLKKSLGISGAESLSVAGNVFLGQTEAPLLVRPFLGLMSRSELNTLMTGGMATIAGGVLAAYIGFLGGDNDVERAFFAKHLLTASFLSAPASILFAKLLYPEQDKIANSDESNIKLPYGNSLLESITVGTTDGLKLAVNVAAMLLVFISLIALGNYILTDVIGELLGVNVWISENTPYEALSFQFILGYLMAPFAWLLGVPAEDIVLVGQLIGEKTVLNEFVAYVTLGDFLNANMLQNEKSVVMVTYMLCGFSNFSSIGIQLGGIGALAPERRQDLGALAMRALLGASLACLLTGAIVGIFF